MIVKIPKLEKWQRDVFDMYNNTKGKWLIIKSLRQSGKSFLAQVLLIYASLKQENSVSICVSPVLLQSRKMYEDIYRMARDLITKANGSTLELTFINGSKILFKSGEQGDTIRGNTVINSGIVVCDESAYLKDDLFFSIIVPTTTVYNAPIFCFSTPRYKQGFFYNLYMQGLSDNDKVISFDWNAYDTSKYLPDETKEIYRQQMPHKSFLTEVLGEFIDGEGSVFSNFTSCLRDNIEMDKSLPVTISVDWAVGLGQDYTVISFLQYSGGVLRLIKQIEFNDKTANQTIDTLINICKDLMNDNVPEINLINERNGIGNVFNQILLDRLDDLQSSGNRYGTTEINSTLFTTTNKSKDKIVKEFNLLVENNKILLPNDKGLIAQLSAFECKINASGSVVYSAPNGQHDDRVMSLLIGVDKLYTDLTNE